MREDDSSSPNADLSIVALTPRGTGGERWELHLSDGSSFFVTRESLQLAEIGREELAPGAEIGRSRAQRLFECSRVLEARDKALELLARRAHSVQELRLKLTQRKFAPSHIDRALEMLNQGGYLDDRGFAREWVERRIERHPEGSPALIAGLRRRGIARDVAEEVVAGLCSAESERAAAERALAKLRRRGVAGSSTGAEEVQRLRRVLQRRGFRSSLILELLPQQGAGEAPADPDRPSA